MSMKSPVPAPDQSVFDSHVFSSKKKTPSNRPQCPSPPLKTPPVSRIFNDQPLFTPTAKIIKTPGTTLACSPERVAHTPYTVSYFDQCFENLGEIGSGSFGHVFKARSKANSQLYAIKRSRHQFRGAKDRQRALNEVWFAAQLPQHPHVLQYSNAWEEHGYLFIQTELCEVGSLKDLLEKRNGNPLPEETIWEYLLDMVLGLKHIHLHNLLHLDIKPANLFLTVEGHLKIGDFGLVQHLGECVYDMEGDSRYMAMELLNEDAASVAFSADIFCLGATCFELACNVEMPSSGSTWVELRNGNVNTHIPPHVSLELRSAISAMMAPDASARPTPDQLLSHWKLRQLLSGRLYSSDTIPIYHQPAKLTSSPPIPEIPLPLPPSSKTPFLNTFLPSPVGSISPHAYTRPPPSALSRAPHSNSSSESSGDDTPDDDDEFLVQPRALLFTSEREKQRRESLEGTFEIANEPRTAVAPKNLLDIFNSTDDDAMED